MKILITLLSAFLIAFSANMQNLKSIKIDRTFNKKIKSIEMDKTNSFILIKEFINDDISFKKIKEDSTYLKSNKGRLIHEQYQQYYKGIKVEDGIYIVHSKEDKIVSINGNIIQMKDFNINPEITDNEALEISLNLINAEIYSWESNGNVFFTTKTIPKGELLFITDSLNNLRLVYKFIIETLEPLDCWFVYVDAKTTEIVNAKSLIENSNEAGTAATRYSGTQTIYTNYSSINGYYLNNYNYGASYVYNANDTFYYYPTTHFYDSDNNWSIIEWDNLGKDNIALDISWACWNVKEFLHNIIGINSYNNNNGTLRSWCHYGVNYEQASSWPNSDGMLFGDGNGASTDPWGCLDIVAHEIGHKIIYAALSSQNINDGGLKEGFCDIFAIGAENYIAPSKDHWKFGEEICLNSPYFIRSWSNPKSFGKEGYHADTYGGDYWSLGDYQKSTVLSHWFYIINEGKSGTNDVGNIFSVNGIDEINESAHIVYSVLNNYLTPSVTFQDIKEQSIEYIQDTYGEVSEESINAMQAWYAVGVPGDCGVNIENITIDNSSPYINLNVGDCEITFRNVSYSSGTDASYKGGLVTISNDFNLPATTTLQIN